MTRMHVVVDIEIGKVLRTFDSRDDAAEYVGRLLQTNGEDYVHDLSISRQGDDGRFVEAVSGDDLLALVREAAGSRALATAGGSSGRGSSGGGSYGSGDSGSGYEALAAKGRE